MVAKGKGQDLADQVRGAMGRPDDFLDVSVSVLGRINFIQVPERSREISEKPVCGVQCMILLRAGRLAGLMELLLHRLGIN